MEEKLELKFAQIDKSGAIEFTNKWLLSEYNNGAFFLTKDDKSLVGRRIVMLDDSEQEIWTSKIMCMDNVFFDSEKVKYNYLSSNAINIKNMPNMNKSYHIYVEGTELYTNLSIEMATDKDEIVLNEEVNGQEKSICDYLKGAIANLQNESKYTFFHNKSSVNFVRFAHNKFQFSAVDKDNGNIWLEVEYRTPAEEEALKEAVRKIKNDFKEINLVEVSKDEEKFASIAEIMVKN
nr:hypothetical protein [uncultured Clostridium sp.]